MVENANLEETDQLAIYKLTQAVELESTKNNTS